MTDVGAWKGLLGAFSVKVTAKPLDVALLDQLGDPMVEPL